MARLEDPRIWRVALGLTMAAGFTDAVGWISTGGLFVSFMSGNVTKLGLGLAGVLDNALLGAALLASFVTGVVLGSTVGRAAGDMQAYAVLRLVALLMALSAALLSSGTMVPAVLLLAAAMGAKNTAFAEDGEVKVGLTYLTGALVRLGKRIATALHGGDRWGWLAPLGLFAAMLGGATLGALASLAWGPRALWVAVLAVVLMAMAVRRLATPAQPG